MVYGRYDEAIKCHSDTVKFLTKAIAESTIPQNIENLILQRKRHESMQQIISQQKHEFADFLRRNGLKVMNKRRDQASKENRDENIIIKVNGGVIIDCDKEAINGNGSLSLVGDLKIDEKRVVRKEEHEDSSDEDDKFVSLE